MFQAYETATGSTVETAQQQAIVNALVSVFANLPAATAVATGVATTVAVPVNVPAATSVVTANFVPAVPTALKPDSVSEQAATGSLL